MEFRSDVQFCTKFLTIDTDDKRWKVWARLHNPLKYLLLMRWHLNERGWPNSNSGDFWDSSYSEISRNRIQSTPWYQCDECVHLCFQFRLQRAMPIHSFSSASRISILLLFPISSLSDCLIQVDPRALRLKHPFLASPAAPRFLEAQPRSQKNQLEPNRVLLMSRAVPDNSKLRFAFAFLNSWNYWSCKFSFYPLLRNNFTVNTIYFHEWISSRMIFFANMYVIFNVY